MAHLTVVASGKAPLCNGKRAAVTLVYRFSLVRYTVLSIAPSLLRQWPQRLRASSPIAAGLAISDIGKRYYAQGVVKVQSNPVSRLVRVRRRDTGVTLVEGRSEAGGFFSLSWADYSGAVDVTVYDEGGAPYNAKIFDMVLN